jgi:hypothetical protein
MTGGSAAQSRAIARVLVIAASTKRSSRSRSRGG